MAGSTGDRPATHWLRSRARAPIFTRKGDDIHIELPIPLREAVLGGKINVPTVEGPVSMTIP